MIKKGMDPHRFCQLQLEVFNLQEKLKGLRRELNTFPEALLIEHISQLPGDMIPVTENHVVAHELERKLPVITQGTLMNYLLKFWRDCDPDAPDDVVLSKAQQQFDIMMEYREPTLSHRFRIVKVDDLQKYTVFRINNQQKRLDKGILKPTRKRKQKSDVYLQEQHK